MSLAIQIAHSLQGTADGSVQSYLEYHDIQDAPADIEEQVYALVDRCAMCDWWHRKLDLRLNKKTVEFNCMECNRPLFLRNLVANMSDECMDDACSLCTKDDCSHDCHPEEDDDE